jgi:allophanate hydrolase subunit 1
VRLVIYYHFQKSFNETTEKRLNELESHNKNDVQEIKHKLIRIETILEQKFKIDL